MCGGLIICDYPKLQSLRNQVSKLLFKVVNFLLHVPIKGLIEVRAKSPEVLFELLLEIGVDFVIIKFYVRNIRGYIFRSF